MPLMNVSPAVSRRLPPGALLTGSSLFGLAGGCVDWLCWGFFGRPEGAISCVLVLQTHDLVAINTGRHEAEGRLHPAGCDGLDSRAVLQRSKTRCVAQSRPFNHQKMPTEDEAPNRARSRSTRPHTAAQDRCHGGGGGRLRRRMARMLRHADKSPRDSGAAAAVFPQRIGSLAEQVATVPVCQLICRSFAATAAAEDVRQRMARVLRRLRAHLAESVSAPALAALEHDLAAAATLEQVMRLVVRFAHRRCFPEVCHCGRLVGALRSTREGTSWSPAVTDVCDVQTLRLAAPMLQPPEAGPAAVFQADFGTSSFPFKMLMDMMQ